MQKLILFSFLVSFVTLCNSLSLPSNFKKCDKTQEKFNSCLSQAIHNAIKGLKTSDDKYGIPSLEPFVLPKEVVVEFGDATTGVAQKYTNFKISGLTGVEKTTARMDFETNTLTVELTFGEVHFLNDYEAHGKVIFLPIDTSTKSDVTFKQPTFTLTFSLEEYEKNNEKYYKLSKVEASMQPQEIIFDYDKLFKSQLLSDLLTSEMSKNWKEIYNVVGPQYRAIYSQWFGLPLKNLLEKVPIKELFGGE